MPFGWHQWLCAGVQSDFTCISMNDVYHFAVTHVLLRWAMLSTAPSLNIYGKWLEAMLKVSIIRLDAWLVMCSLNGWMRHFQWNCFASINFQRCVRYVCTARVRKKKRGVKRWHGQKRGHGWEWAEKKRCVRENDARNENKWNEVRCF